MPYAADIYTERDGSITAVAPRPHLGVREVHFEGLASSYDLEYLVDVPEESGRYEFGPAEVRSPDATRWAEVSDTTTGFYVAGGEL